ncbi:hypothetical protein FB446DRAFT_795789 [Lentinula raphanica]|nr:hypothetical protein FB446DRAFT_795789 [Lentinula raphanica]
MLSNEVDHSSQLQIYGTVETLFKQFYDKNPDSEFRRTFSDYLGRAGKWLDERMSLAWFRQDAKEQNTSVDIVRVWQEQIMSDVNDTRGSNGMVVMAMWICSIVPNSASAERIFSRFAAVHTKARNRMTPEHTRKIIILSNHIQRKHEGDDEDDPGDLDAIPIASFHEVAREIMEANEEENTEDDLTAEEARKLKNLFDYPSLSHPNDQTFAFMTEFWQRGERGLQAETTRHESFMNEFAFVDSDNDEDL